MTSQGSQPRRRFPRVDLRVKARLSLQGAAGRRFEATLPTANVSLGGLFLESTFFLKVGMRLEVELFLPAPEPPRRKGPSHQLVRARGVVVRVETAGARGEGQSGFAVRFDEFLDGTDALLARHFLGPVLEQFLTEYAAKQRFEPTLEFMTRMADVLTAWELSKSQGGGVGLLNEPQAALPRRRRAR